MSNNKFENVLWSTRFIVIIAVILSIISSISLFLIGGWDIIQATIFNNPIFNSDINNSNDSLFFDFDVQEGNFYNIQVQTDNYAEEVSWTILNENQDTTYIYNQLVSNELNTENICLNTDSCYTFEITDEYSDGICCDFGNGYIAINNEIFSGEFESELSVDLCELSSIKTHDHNGKR